MNSLSKIWDIPLLLMLSLIWASSFSAIKIAVPDLGPVGVVFARCFIGGLFMLGIVMMSKGASWPQTFKEWFLLTVVGILSTALPFFLISFAEQEISSSMTAILMTTGPLAVIVLGHFFTDDEKINRGKVIGIGVGFGAAVYLLRAGLGEFNGAGLLHPMAAMGAAFCYAVGGLMAKKMVNVTPEVIAAFVLVSSALFMVPFLWVVELPSLASLERDVILAVIWLGVMPSGFAFYFRYFLIKRNGYGFVSYVGYLIPLFAIGIGMVVLDEEVTLDTVLAMMLILMGLFITRSADDFPWTLSKRLHAFRARIN